jgi:hypothetical protein
MRKQKIFDINWSGCVSNNWFHDSIVADSISDAEHKAMRFFIGIKQIHRIEDSGNEVYAPVSFGEENR